MTMNRLFRHTITSTLRLALLFGAIMLVNTQTQIKAQTAGLPDAFETMDPASIIGDGNYYYIQFYNGSDRSFLSDQGSGNDLRSKDYVPFAKNIQWTLESTGTDGQFYLKSRSGHYVYLDGGSFKCGSTYSKSALTCVLRTNSTAGGGYDISAVTATADAMCRPGGAVWTNIISYSHNNHRYPYTRLRIARLKENIAHIIYYQDPIPGVSNMNTDTRGGSAGFMLRHYLTYSGTDPNKDGDPNASNFWTSDVSSRSSILNTYDNWVLPTAAAYHKDGLWALEESDVEGRFYIKKYGTGQYLNKEEKRTDVYGSELGGQNAAKGIYSLESPNANRYTRIQNVQYTEDNLTASLFKNWDGYGADATVSSDASVDYNVGNGATINARGMVVGTSTVEHLTYANLSDYSKMIINGTQGMQLRVLMSRQESNNGPLVEKNVTIGSNGKAVVDLTGLELTDDPTHPLATQTGNATVKMTYVNGSDDAVDTSYGEVSTAYCGYNKISGGNTVNLANKGWGINNIAYLQIDASNINGTISKVTLKGEFQQITERALQYGVGYNNSTWSSTMTWNTADRTINTLGDAQYVTNTTTDDKELSFVITDETFINGLNNSKKKTILIYNIVAGAGYIKNPVVEVEYTPNVNTVNITYAHLNAIKAGYSSPSGTISSITLQKAQNTYYLHHADGDGWQVLQWSGNDPNYWSAGFYPVEVVDEDEFYNVSLKHNNQMVGVGDEGTAALKDYNDFNPELWQLEQLDDYGHFRFQSWNNLYYDGIGNPLTTTAPTGTDRGIYSNTDINSMFTVRFLPNTETRIPYDVTHKISNVRLYYAYNPTSAEKQELYSQQGLVTEDLSEWQNADGTQKVNEFKITHYVKKGEVVSYFLPTVLNANNDHRLFQRWYNYDNDRDLAGLKDRFRLKVDGVEAMSYLYNNGVVTGERLDWGTVFPGARTYELNKLTYYNSDGNNFTLAGDVSRYSDFRYWNTDSHLEGNLEEPSLTMRYIFYMKDAKEMANNLMACTEGSSNWLEDKTFHFPATTVAYEDNKSAEYQGEFLGLRHIFRDYWVFDGSGTEDANLVSAVTNTTSGLIEVEVEAGGTGITKGGKGDKGYYLYDEGRNGTGAGYEDSRFVAFKYPAEGTVSATGESNPAYLKVYFNNGGTRYQIAKFTIIFDDGTATLPWKSVNGSSQVKDTDRDPKKLEATAGKPIAKITFDYPQGQTFKNSSDYTIHNIGVMVGQWSEIPNSSPLPLTFDNTNYGFDGENPSWGSYALVSTMSTRYGNKMTAMPVDDNTYGYGIAPDAGMQSAFLYIDASEQPGDICSIPFKGEFCAGDKLMCSGWISGSNKVINDNRCPGSVTITVKGERTEGGVKVEDNIYRFCPGQCYELDDGDGIDGGTNVYVETSEHQEGQTVYVKDENGNYVATTEPQSGQTMYVISKGGHVVWQQFYFEFSIDRKYERQWIEVNNNCVSSTGGDFMLDNIEVYAMVPEVIPEMNSPICVNNTESELQLLKLEVGFEKLITSTGVNTSSADPEGGHSFGIVFLDKQKFLEKLREGLNTYNHLTLSLAQVEQNVEAGLYKDITSTYQQAYQYAFDAALLGTPTIWDSNSPNSNQGAGILNFHWYHHFEQNPLFSFAEAVNRLKPIFRYTDPETQEKFLVMNGNFPKLEWKLNTDYYIIYYNQGITDASMRFSDFNICSDCSKERVFQLEPPYKILSMDSSDETQELEVCEGKIPTVLTDLTAYNTEGVQVRLKDLNFDWWLGDPGDPTADPVVPPTLATLDNYHSQVNSSGERLDVALSTLRAYYPDATSLDGIRQHLAVSPNPSLTMTMVEYLQELVDAGQLVLHQKSVNIPMKKASETDPYCYLVACPIHDASFDQSLNTNDDKYVAYFCDEPQGLRLKVGEKAPTLKCGFVPNENGFTSYDYSSVNDAVLSIRLAKKQQFETVQHGEKTEEPQLPAAHTDLHYLWLPIRNATVQTEGSSYITKAADYNVYLASTDDPVGDKAIYREASATGSLPIVGKIVDLNAVDVAKGGTENGNNKLCIYFTENFEVREGYSYTLSMPFRENGDANTCDGTLLINLKIVPDYEVWTGAAGNTDWNNDQNWRRADGNMATSTTESPDGSKRNNNELYRTTDLPEESPLKEYVTNYTNYRTAKDRILRKGFAPLYCTHVLMKSNEWGDAPVLYDALDNATTLSASPFPNLRDTSTPILKFDMQARHYEKWSEVYGSNPDKGREGDLIAEMYQVNSCDEIAFQPGAELLNAHLLNYNNAWVEYQLDMKRWYLLGSPLQGTISGEWYAPTGTAQQKTTYYENVTFGEGYDRYSPAIYQRSWDKAKAVLYEVGADYSTTDNPNDLSLENDGSLPGSANQGTWSGATWNANSADSYLDRLGYKPLGGNKANVAIKGIWSNTYNDATVDYTKGGFSVMILNNLKGNSNIDPAIIRLPKEDTMYDYYQFSQTGAADGGTDTNLSDVRTLNRAKNRGRLKTDLLLPASTNKTETTASRYGDKRTYTRVPTKVGEGFLPMTLSTFTETASPGISGLGYYLVENPFPCGLNMDQFFAANTGLEKKYWLLTATGQHLVQKAASGDWITQTGEPASAFADAQAVVAPGQGFFVQATTAGEATTITFNKDMQAKTRYGVSDEGTEFEIVVGTKQVMETKLLTYDDDDDPETAEVPLMIDDENNPGQQVQATTEVPKVDDYGNFVVEDIKDKITIYSYKQTTDENQQFPLKTRGEVAEALLPGLVITAKRDNSESSALVMQHEGASNDFLPSEDTEAFITSDFENVPTVYTLCGRLATTINSIHDFRSLPIGVESTSNAPCTLTFRGVEMLGDSIAFYDAVKQELTPLESGMSFKVSGQTQNRYYLVRSLNQKEAAEETHLQIFTEGLTAKVIASTAEPIVVVRCFDTAGRLIYSAEPQTSEYSFSLPRTGIYIIEAQTENDRKTMKAVVR